MVDKKSYEYQYDYSTSPKKLNPKLPIKTSPKATPKKTNKQSENKDINKKEKESQKAEAQKIFIRRFKMVCILVMGFSILFAISYRYSLINEEFKTVQKFKRELSELEKQNDNLIVSIENKINLSAIEKTAKEKFDMHSLDKSQITYVNLDKKDYIELATENVKIKEDNSWWRMILNEINRLLGM